MIQSFFHKPGRQPENLVPWMSTKRSLSSSPNSEGIGPVSPFPSRSSFRFTNRPNSGEIGPVSPFPGCLSMDKTLGETVQGNLSERDVNKIPPASGVIETEAARKL